MRKPQAMVWIKSGETALFLLSLFPAVAVEIDVYGFTAHYPNIPAEELAHLITADLLAKWPPNFIKFLRVPPILILLLSRFGSDFGGVTLRSSFQSPSRGGAIS